MLLGVVIAYIRELVRNWGRDQNKKRNENENEKKKRKDRNAITADDNGFAFGCRKWQKGQEKDRKNESVNGITSNGVVLFDVSPLCRRLRKIID